MKHSRFPVLGCLTLLALSIVSGGQAKADHGHTMSREGRYQPPRREKKQRILRGSGNLPDQRVVRVTGRRPSRTPQYGSSRYSGRIIEIPGRSGRIALQSADGTIYRFGIPSNTRIYRNRRWLSVRQLREGDHVVVRTAVIASGRRQVSRIDVE